MKIIGIFIMLVLCAATTCAQNITTDDSIKAVILDEVIVSAKQKRMQQNPYNFFSINKSATTEDILSRLPELSMIRRGSYGMEPVIRSYNSGQLNLLLDGMKIHGACTDKMDPASIYIEPGNLHSIEVKTNGSSSINGPSIGGSINMRLAEAACHDEKNFSVSANSGYQSAANGFHQSVRMDYATTKWGLRATGTYRKSNEYRDGNEQKVPFSQYEKINYSLHGKYKINDNTYLKLDLLADDGWDIGYPALPMDVGYANARIGAVTVIKENASNGWKKIEAKLYANKVKHFMDDSKRPNVPLHMDMPGRSITAGFYVEGIKSIRDDQQIKFRADASSTSLTASMTMYQDGQPPMYMLTWPDNRQIQSGLAFEYLLQIDSSTQLQWNGRADMVNYSLTSSIGKDQLAVFGYDGNNKKMILPSISAGISRKIFRQLKASLSLGINSRTPTASELYGFYLFNQFDGYDYIGNPELKQEFAQQAELSLSWQQKKLRIHTSAYLSKVDNYIMGTHEPALSAMTIGARGVKMYENIKHAMLAGLEGSITYNPLPYTQIISTIKYAYAKDNNSAPLPMIPPLRSTLAARQHFDNLWIQAEFEAAAKQDRVSVAAKEKATGEFSLFHIRAGYQGKAKTFSWQLNAGVENILDAYYREHLDWGNIARTGRNVYVQFGLSL